MSNVVPFPKPAPTYEQRRDAYYRAVGNPWPDLLKTMRELGDALEEFRRKLAEAERK